MLKRFDDLTKIKQIKTKNSKVPCFFQMPFGKEAATKHARSPIHTQTITCEPLVALIGPSFIAFLN
jgi:hypothetical protein